MPQPLSLTTILPTYNERDNIPILIDGILRHVRPPGAFARLLEFLRNVRHAAIAMWYTPPACYG